ncbi:MAG: PEGA domain-containing protein [candidate division KSB1 bacterium]|nr:PEGA domain-containing protein [candidate division KSB1 bacterium]MDZ7305229.1 PEGA domain-containing protein [candidate division KSB1 bacterium]MDZ7314340.1 PEGA domain-containing protein [candidate division KSB1 bacterium]
MSAFHLHPSHSFFPSVLGRIGVLLFAAGFMACGAGGKLTTDRAYRELKPKEQLPERELRQLPENLLIKIENVADAGSSYRNYVVLFINGREIAPIEKLSNFSAKYTYPLRLQHGLYEVRAEYHVVGFWREQVFEILPDEPVKVMPGKRTVLTCRLDKDYKGRPTQKPVRFHLQYENSNDYSEPGVSLKPSVSKPAVATPLIQEVPKRALVTTAPQPERQVEPQPPIQESPVLPPALPEGVLTLQINTTPSGADITVDDRYLGQSPLKVTVTANQNHVVQVAKPGHQEVVKVIDAKELRGQKTLQLLLKLEPAAQP